MLAVSLWSPLSASGLCGVCECSNSYPSLSLSLSLSVVWVSRCALYVNWGFEERVVICYFI